MKQTLTILMILICFSSAFAQERQKFTSAKTEAKGSIDGVGIKINYHQPSAHGRKIMGELVPFGEVWRTGANNATTIEFDKDAKVEGKSIAAGKYALFTIPGENEWVIIFNKNHDQWGAYSYDQNADVLRVTVQPSKATQFVETFTIAVEKKQVRLMWENTSVAFSVKK